MGRSAKQHFRASVSGVAVFLSVFWCSTASGGIHAVYQGRLTLANGAGAIARPSAVSIDASRGEICVTDEPGACLQVFNSRGVLVFRTDRVSGLSNPEDACVDTLGRLVCTDMGSSTERTIRRLNFLGEPDDYRPQVPAPGWYPTHLTLTRDGGYVTLDQGSGLIAKHDPATGALLWQRQLGGSKAGEVMLGRPAEAPDGKLYVPGGELHEVLILSPDGDPLTSFGEMGSAAGHLIFPVGVGFAPDGRVLVLDRMRHTVLLYDHQLKFVTEFGGFGAGQGQFYHPVALAASPAGLFYVAQGFESRIQVFRLLDSEAGSAVLPFSSSDNGTAVSSLSPATKGVSMK
jgi:DNA-binding beta-propeller fold protein YncE